MLRLKEILKDKSISASALEQMMASKGYKLSRISIGNILNGKHSPKVETLEQIADTVDVDICAMFKSSKDQGCDVRAIYVKDAAGKDLRIGEIDLLNLSK